MIPEKFTVNANGGNVVKRILSGVALAFGMVVGSAQAALNTEASTALTTITGTVTDMETGVWPIVAAATVALIGFKLFKRFSNRV